ncbi:MAG: ATP-dependent DNA helicase RecG [Candidatus Nealsonbacteria bacterium]|nr:ATP-dependent DNA helicase RecG [Candidatus Nealsonbacteria bacterium]
MLKNSKNKKMNLLDPIEKIPRIGPIYQKKLKKLGIKTLRDLLFHFPYRYDDFSKITPISKIKIGETQCVQGEILEIETTRTWKRKIFLTQAVLKDETGAIKIIWFNQPYLINVLKKGDKVCLAGKLTLGKKGLYFANPAYEKIYLTDQSKILIHTGRLVPVYPETQGLSSRWLRFILRPVLMELKNKIEDPLPQKIKEKNKLLDLNKALWQIHFPDSINLAKAAQERLSFDELFFIELLVLKERMKINQQKGVSIPINVELVKKLVSSLPFRLTDSQKKCGWQILKDIEKSRPMNRLLEGDVGSGKTVVAALAILNTTKARFQVAFMAPTEILAKQHFQGVSKLLGNFNLNVGLLTGKSDKFISKRLKNQVIEASRKKILEKVLEGEIDLLIGTHALIQDQVKFKNLALVILDEQHRFGVEQRARLIAKEKQKNNGKVPHLLSMTATPIPRTLALTIYGDLDLSLINEMPKGRKKIITKIISPANRPKAYKFIEKQAKSGRQVFVICPRIEPKNSEELKKIPESLLTQKDKALLNWAEVKAVKEEYEKLSQKIFPDLKVGMLHGKLSSGEKEKVMADFKKKKIQILVSTSVVEVGVDIPEATVMMIEGAERFGLAQLHQFRGRVGRSLYQSFCFLFTDSPAKKTKLRLKALVKCNNGFELSEKDLQIRGPGNVLGTRQWGIPDLAMSALKDIFLVEKIRKEAKDLLDSDPELKKHLLLAKKLGEFQKIIHLE